MTKQETIQITKVLVANYAEFERKMSSLENANIVIDLWTKMFVDTDFQMMKKAVINFINTSKFPPTIADIKDEIYKLNNTQALAVDLWNELLNACRNCLYDTEQVFDNLSEPIRRFLKNSAQLRELAMLDSEVLNTVTKGQFLKQIEIIQKQEKEKNIMLPECKNLINTLAEKLDANKTT